MDGEVTQDLRKLKRCKIKDGVYLASKPKLDILGKVKDLSTGGICFEHPVYGDKADINMVDIDVYTKETMVHLKGVQLKLIYNLSMPVHPLSIETRRCGLQFSCLSLKQSATLLYICNKYAIPSDLEGELVN